MTTQGWTIVALASSATAGLLAVGLLFVLAGDRRRRRLARPNWERMLTDNDYFRLSVSRVLQARGYHVKGFRVMRDPLERQDRQILFALVKKGEIYAAVCFRWAVPITSEIISHFGESLAATKASRGMIVTTSWFTDAAKVAAHELPVELLNGDQLQIWMDSIWS